LVFKKVAPFEDCYEGTYERSTNLEAPGQKGLGSRKENSNREETVMKPTDVERFRRDLELRRQEAVQFLTRLGNNIRTLDVDSAIDSADRCVVSLSRETLFQEASQRRTLLLLLDDALQRIGDGSFGMCEACGDDIRIRRLEALPWTRYCLKCQESAEQNVPADAPALLAKASARAWRRAG
jgi:DnaK suppressor protein